MIWDHSGKNEAPDLSGSVIYASFLPANSNAAYHCCNARIRSDVVVEVYSVFRTVGAAE